MTMTVKETVSSVESEAVRVRKRLDFLNQLKNRFPNAKQVKIETDLIEYVDDSITDKTPNAKPIFNLAAHSFNIGKRPFFLRHYVEVKGIKIFSAKVVQVDEYKLGKLLVKLNPTILKKLVADLSS